jgi:hypothetical protein
MKSVTVESNGLSVLSMKLVIGYSFEAALTSPYLHNLLLFIFSSHHLSPLPKWHMLRGLLHTYSVQVHYMLISAMCLAHRNLLVFATWTVLSRLYKPRCFDPS